MVKQGQCPGLSHMSHLGFVPSSPCIPATPQLPSSTFTGWGERVLFLFPWVKDKYVNYDLLSNVHSWTWMRQAEWKRLELLVSGYPAQPTEASPQRPWPWGATAAEGKRENAGFMKEKKNRTYFSVSAVSVLDKCQVCAWEFLSFPVLLHGVREARASPPFAPLPSIFSWACGRCSLWVVSIRMDWMGSIRTVVKTRKLLWAV